MNPEALYAKLAVIYLLELYNEKPTSTKFYL